MDIGMGDSKNFIIIIVIDGYIMKVIIMITYSGNLLWEEILPNHMILLLEEIFAIFVLYPQQLWAG